MQRLSVAMMMTPAVVTVTPRLPLVTALRMMQDHRLFTVPVVSLGEVVGLLHASDLLPLCGSLLRVSPSQRLPSAL